MSSARENHEYSQLIKQREAAYAEYHNSERLLKNTRQLLKDIDRELRPTDEAAVDAVYDQMSKIDFLQARLDDGLNGETEKFAKEELEARFKILYQVLEQNAKYRGDTWKVKKEQTYLYHDLQKKLPKLQRVISGFDHSFFEQERLRKAATNASSAKDIDKEVDEITVEWAAEQGLIPDEHDIEREIWDEEVQWYEIDAESKQRAIDELKEQLANADKFEKRMKQAMSLEVQIEATREKLHRSVGILREVQNEKLYKSRQLWDEEQEANHKLEEYKARERELQHYFEEVVPIAQWPSLLTEDARTSSHPEVLAFKKQFLQTHSRSEYREFLQSQIAYKRLQSGGSRTHRLEDKVAKCTAAIDKFHERILAQEHKMKERIQLLREDLNMKNGMRAAELKVALPRITVNWEQQVLENVGELPDFDPKSFVPELNVFDELETALEHAERVAKETGRSVDEIYAEVTGEDLPKFSRKPTNSDDKSGFMHFTDPQIIEASAPTQSTEAAQADTIGVSSTIEVDASTTISVSALASADVYRKVEENENKTEATLAFADDTVNARGDALAYALQQHLSGLNKIPWETGIRADPNNGLDPNYNGAADKLNEMHENGELVGEPFILSLENRSKLEKMLAFRCGFILGRDKTVHVEVLERGEPTGNSIYVRFLKNNAVGQVSIIPNLRTGDWKIRTCKHNMPEWSYYSMNTPGVPALAKNNPKTTVLQYLEYHRKIEENINAKIAIEAESQKDKKKANG